LSKSKTRADQRGIVERVLRIHQSQKAVVYEALFIGAVLFPFVANVLTGGSGSAQARHDSSASRSMPLTREPTGSEASASIQAGESPFGGSGTRRRIEQVF